MADRFDVQRKMERAGSDVFTRARAGLDRAKEMTREEAARLIKLSVGYYFDPKTKGIYKKSGSAYQFVRHDRRKKARLNAEEAARFKEVQGGLFWDATEKRLYRKQGDAFILLTKDRRKEPPGKSPTGNERRKG
jgi:hypothetical protein